MGGNRFLEFRQRQLTAAEIRLLRARMSSLQRRGQRAASKGLWTGVFTIIVLWAMTIVASDAPALLITAFWLVAGALNLLWVRSSLDADRSTFKAIAAGLHAPAVHFDDRFNQGQADA